MKLKTLFRFSLAECILGTLLLAGLFFTVNCRHTDELINYDPRGRGNWIWLRDEGYPFVMREMGSLGPFPDFEKLQKDDFLYDPMRLSGPRLKPSGLSKQTPPDDSTFSGEVSISGIVYNLLIDLAVLFALHLLFVIYWRERQKEKPIHAP